MEQDIGGLEVPVQDFLPVQQLESRAQLREYLDSLVLGQTLLAFDIVSQGAAIAELIHQVVVIISP